LGAIKEGNLSVMVLAPKRASFTIGSAPDIDGGLTKLLLL